MDAAWSQDATALGLGSVVHVRQTGGRVATASRPEAVAFGVVRDIITRCLGCKCINPEKMIRNTRDLYASTQYMRVRLSSLSYVLRVGYG